MDTVKHLADRVDHTLGANNDREGAATKQLERVTAALPSGTWLILAGGPIGGRR